MAKTSNNSKERNIFTEIDFQIMLCNEKIKNHIRSIEKIKKMCGWYGPSGVNGINYSKESASVAHISFQQGLEMIKKDEDKIKSLEEEKKELRRSRKRIQKIYSGLTGYEAQIFHHRAILQHTQTDAAKKIGLSVRQFQRLERDMKDKGVL